jgi:hypothetical protein
VSKEPNHWNGDDFYTIVLVLCIAEAIGLALIAAFN